MDRQALEIITQFGEPVRAPITTPGLYFDLPIIQSENTFDKRALEYQSQPTQVPTKDKRYINVTAFALWRIADPLKFFQRVQDQSGGQARLADILDGEIRSAVARYNLIDLVRTTNRNRQDVAIQTEGESVILQSLEKGRRNLELEVLARASGRAADLGISVLDVRFRRMTYVEDVQKEVYARMIAEHLERPPEYRLSANILILFRFFASGPAAGPGGDDHCANLHEDASRANSAKVEELWRSEFAPGC